MLVGLPAIAFFGILIALLWFKILLEDEKEDIKKRLKKEEMERKKWKRLKNRKYEGGGFSFLLFIGLCIYVFIDGKWLTPFGSLSYSYFVIGYLTVCVWVLIIFGIPLAIIAILWLLSKFDKEV